MMPVGLDERFYPQPGDPVGWAVPKQTQVKVDPKTGVSSVVNTFGIGEPQNFRIKGDGSDSQNASKLLASLIPMTFAHGGTMSLFTHLYNLMQHPKGAKDRLNAGMIQSPGLRAIIQLTQGTKQEAESALAACMVATGMVLDTSDPNHEHLAWMWAADQHFRFVLEHYVGRCIRDNRFSVENKSESWEVQLCPY